MTFRFLHTADWHIGKAFGGFPPDRAALLREARLTAISRLAAVATEHSAKHVVVAGDIFDSSGLPDRDLRKVMSLLKTAGTLHWCLLPGNHDPDQDRGLWERIVQFGVPDNVHLLRTAEPYRLEHNVVLLPAPLEQRQSAVDPTAWFESAERGSADIVIGLAHGSIHDFGGADEASILISPERAVSARLDYLALGDWHGARAIKERVWYSGSPESDSYVDNQSGHALVVEIDGAGALPRVKQVPTGQYKWQRERIELGIGNSGTDVLARIAEHETEAARLLLRLDLTGQLGVSEEIRLVAELDAIGASFFNFDVRMDQLGVVADENMETLYDSVAVSNVAQRLHEAAVAGDGDDARVARRALQILAGSAAVPQDRSA
ncbi:MAG: metallophosphoesterase family protein [Hyphomicrobiaceae bacterium]